MGHIHLAELPSLDVWREVIALIAEEGTVEEIAGATMKAAKAGLEMARHDRGLIHTVEVLTGLVQASMDRDFAAALNRSGISVSGDPDVFEVVAGFSQAMDAYLRDAGGRSDIGEMAQLAATECLAARLSAASPGLFATTAVDVQSAAQGLTAKGFSALATDFFSRFTYRFLTYHLGRELSLHVGGNGRFADTWAHTDFLEKLESHCHAVASAAADFSGEWFERAGARGSVSDRVAHRFVNSVLTNVQQEFQDAGARDGE